MRAVCHPFPRLRSCRPTVVQTGRIRAACLRCRFSKRDAITIGELGPALYPHASPRDLESDLVAVDSGHQDAAAVIMRNSNVAACFDVQFHAGRVWAEIAHDRVVAIKALDRVLDENDFISRQGSGRLRRALGFGSGHGAQTSAAQFGAKPRLPNGLTVLTVIGERRTARFRTSRASELVADADRRRMRSRRHMRGEAVVEADTDAAGDEECPPRHRARPRRLPAIPEAGRPAGPARDAEADSDHRRLREARRGGEVVTRSTVRVAPCRHIRVQPLRPSWPDLSRRSTSFEMVDGRGCPGQARA